MDDKDDLSQHSTSWKGFEITGRFTFWKYLSGSPMFGEIAEPERSSLEDLENDEGRKGFPPLIWKRVQDRMPLISGPCKSPVRKEKMFR